jgi:hypothetical protein
MTEYRRVRGAVSFWLVCMGGLSLLSACSGFKQMIGLDQPMPDEFAVESRAPLTVPPDFDLRPPEPGAPRPQERSAEQQAEQVMEQAGPGEPGKQAADLRLRGSGGLPEIGSSNAQAPNAGNMVASQSLSNKLLTTGDTGGAGATVEKHETTPLKGIY